MPRICLLYFICLPYSSTIEETSAVSQFVASGESCAYIWFLPDSKIMSVQWKKMGAYEWPLLKPFAVWQLLARMQ